MNPDFLSDEGATFISNRRCPYVKSKEKLNPKNIFLRVSSFDGKSLGVLNVLISPK
jgi:hypothetical protein